MKKILLTLATAAGICLPLLASAALFPNDTLVEGLGDGTRCNTMDCSFGLPIGGGNGERKFGWAWTPTNNDTICGYDIQMQLGSAGSVGGTAYFQSFIYRGTTPGLNLVVGQFFHTGGDSGVAEPLYIGNLSGSSSGTERFVVNPCVQLHGGDPYVITLELLPNTPLGNPYWFAFPDSDTTGTGAIAEWQDDDEGPTWTQGWHDGQIYGVAGRWFGVKNLTNNDPGGCYAHSSSSSTQDWFALGNILRDVISCLFYPTDDVNNILNSAKTDLLSRAPFAYVSSVSSTLAFSNQNTTTTDFSLSLAPSIATAGATTTIDLWNWETIHQRVGNLLDPLKTILAVTMWAGFVIALYYLGLEELRR